MPKKDVRRLYRYQKFSELSLQALCHDKLYFSSPKDFNDPFDCRPSIETDSDSLTLKKTLKSLIKRRVEFEILSSLKRAKSTVDVEVHAKQQAHLTAKNELRNIAYNATDPDYEMSIEDAECMLLTSHIELELLNQNDKGICCLSAEFDNPLLWSHYGEQHKGLCVGYSFDRDPKPVANKVAYGNERSISTSLIARAILEGDKQANSDLDTKMLLRKAQLWSYEREWRIFDQQGLRNSPFLLTDITFGLRCSDAIIYSVISALAQNGIDFFQIEETRGSFELVRRRVQWEEMSSYFPRQARSGVEIFGRNTE